MTASFAVVGAGGVGGLLAALLARAGHDVRVLARGATLAAIRAHGLRIHGPSVEHEVPIARASDDVAALGQVDFVLVTVKTWQVPGVAAELGPLLRRGTLVVPLQNGVEASAQLASVLGQAPVAGAVCTVLSWARSPGEIQWVGARPGVVIGARCAEQGEAVASCAAALGASGVRAQVTDDIERALWTKLLFIAPFGAVGAAEGRVAGPLRGSARTRERLVAAMREVAAVAGARGVVLPADAVDVALRTVDALPEGGMASMHRDLVNGRPSELHELIGAVVRLGREAKVETPVSADLYATLLPLEQRARGTVPGGPVLL